MPESHLEADGWMEQLNDEAAALADKEAEKGHDLSRASIQCAGGYHFLCRDPRCVCPSCGHGIEQMDVTHYTFEEIGP